MGTFVIYEKGRNVGLLEVTLISISLEMSRFIIFSEAISKISQQCYFYFVYEFQFSKKLKI